MKLNDKAKEIADNWIQWAEFYSEINKELESAHPNFYRIREIIEKKDKLITKRAKLLQECRVLVDKASEDINHKFEKHMKKGE